MVEEEHGTGSLDTNGVVIQRALKFAQEMANALEDKNPDMGLVLLTRIEEDPQVPYDIRMLIFWLSKLLEDDPDL